MPAQRRKPSTQRPGGRPQARRTPTRPAAPRPNAGAGTARSFLTPGASPFRHAVERRSATVLLFLRGLPKLVPPLVVVALLAAGLLTEGLVAALCLVVLFGFFAWLLFLSWPGVPIGARLVRLAVLATMVAGIGAKLAT